MSDQPTGPAEGAPEAGPVAGKAGFTEAVGVLAEERGLAEHGASLLKRHAPEDIEARALYAQAKAAFDGLIERLLAELAQGHEPKASVELRARLDHAAERRLAFSRRVDEALRRALPEGAKEGWEEAVARTAGEVVARLLEGLVGAWREWRAGGAERRRDMAARVEAQRWRGWADIPAA